MRVLRTVAELRTLLAAARSSGNSIGLVPTMGFFHEGHLSLMRRARSDTDGGVVSVFVNPALFGPGEDLAAYPRAEERDRRRAEAEGVDMLFAPP
ncbi:MAG: pantoate--beta-alanine ligase, partial [Thermoleophilaceae bacterium]